MVAKTSIRLSCVPWDMLTRATFMPASIIFNSISLVLHAGPTVHTILVFLIISLLSLGIKSFVIIIHYIIVICNLFWKEYKKILPRYRAEFVVLSV